MRLRRRQRGFLLNPYRFEGTVQSGDAVLDGAAVLTFGGASIATGAAESAAAADLIVETDQAASCAMSMEGEGGLTMSGASIAAATKNAAGEGELTLYADVGAAVVDAADFDGSIDYMRRTGLTGATDSKTGILSVWLNLDAISGSILYAFNTSTSKSQFQASVQDIAGTNERFFIGGLDSTGTFVLNINTSDLNLSTSHWYHLLASWDLANAKAHIYVNDVDAYDGAGTLTNTDIDYDAANQITICDNTFNNSKVNAGIAEFYFAPGQYLDFSVESNRRKFINEEGKPANLGTTGEGPTGTPPLIYLHLEDGESAANFAINRGTGGNFTITGSLGTRATSPSD